jgi:hypothetical protein
MHPLFSPTFTGTNQELACPSIRKGGKLPRDGAARGSQAQSIVAVAGV